MPTETATTSAERCWRVGAMAMISRSMVQAAPMGASSVVRCQANDELRIFVPLCGDERLTGLRVEVAATGDEPRREVVWRIEHRMIAITSHHQWWSWWAMVVMAALSLASCTADSDDAGSGGDGLDRDTGDTALSIARSPVDSFPELFTGQSGPDAWQVLSRQHPSATCITLVFSSQTADNCVETPSVSDRDVIVPLEYRRATDGRASLTVGAVPAGTQSIDLANPTGDFRIEVDSGTGIFVLVARPTLEADAIELAIDGASMTCRVTQRDVSGLVYIC
jgi:hypothetical protein